MRKRHTTKGTLLETRSSDKQVCMLTVNLVAESRPLCSLLQPKAEIETWSSSVEPAARSHSGYPDGLAFNSPS